MGSGSCSRFWVFYYIIVIRHDSPAPGPMGGKELPASWRAGKPLAAAETEALAASPSVERMSGHYGFADVTGEPQLRTGRQKSSRSVCTKPSCAVSSRSMAARVGGSTKMPRGCWRGL